MESSQFYNLYEYFNTEIEISLLKTSFLVNRKIPSERFRYYSSRLVSRFIGECNRNIEEYRNQLDYVYREHENIQKKFMFSFKDEFDIEFGDRERKHKDINLKYKESEHSTLLIQAIETKWNTYVSTIKLLDNIISLRPSYLKPARKKRSGKKVQRKDFVLKLNTSLLRQLHSELIEEGLLSEDTNVNNFIKAFSGQEITEKLVWKDDQHALKLFINGLNKKKCFENELGHGKWDIVADIFKPKDRDYYPPLSFSNSSKTKSKKYSYIDHLIYEIVKDIIDSNS